MPAPRRALPDRLLLAFGAAYVALRLAHLVRWDLWFDELFGVGLAYLDWSGLLARAAADQTNPPLFYLLLKGWVALGGADPAWLRLLPLGIALLALWPLVRLLALLRPPGAARTAALALFAVSPMLVFYAVELRAYALLFLLGTAALLETARLTLEDAPGPGAAPRLALWNVLLVYTHYFGGFVIAAEWTAFLLLRRERWRVPLLSALPAVVAFLPWAAAVVHAAAASHTVAPTIAWIARPGLTELLAAPGFLLALGAPRPLAGVGLLALALAVLGVRAPAADPRARATRRLLALFATIPALLAFVASWLLPRSIWSPRYLIESAAPAIVLIGLGLTTLGPRAARAATLALALLALGTLGWGADAKTGWRTLTARLDDGQGAPLEVYTFESYTALPLRYYAGLDGRAVDVRMVRAPSELAGADGWVVERPGAWPGGDHGSEALRRWGLTVTDSASASGPGELVQAWRWRRP